MQDIQHMGGLFSQLKFINASWNWTEESYYLKKNLSQLYYDDFIYQAMSKLKKNAKYIYLSLIFHFLNWGNDFKFYKNRYIVK